VLADGAGVGDDLARRLTAAGGKVTVAIAGPLFRAGEDGHYEIDPSEPEQVRRLVAAAPSGGWGGIVHLWSLDPPATTAERTQAHRTGSALAVVQAALAAGATPKLWLVTRGAQAGLGGSPDPTQAPLWGFGRVVALEHPELRCTRVDLDPSPATDPAQDLVAELRAGDSEDQVMVRAGARWVARLVPSPEVAHDTEPAAPVRVEVAGTGVLDDLALRPVARRAPGPGEVEIRVHAAGLNFRDVMNALALRADESPAGSECAGVVVAVGDGVASVAVGDAVVAVAPGSFGTYATTSAELVAHKPPRLTFAEAATLPLAFLTAHQALHDQAHLAAGDVVLIHAAAGGVGLAAVQLARRAGAVVMGTAGSDRKRAHLGRLGLTAVMDSRGLAFADDVLAATDGRGVDVVVNSLTGDAIGRSLDVLAPGGRFVELGKREIWTTAEVAARAPGVSYSSVPLAEDIEQRPEKVGPVLRDLVAAVDRGELAPLPVQTFALADAAAAFRYMALARHIGKIVLVDPEAEAEGGVGPLVRPDATYLVTGGLAGLGLLVAEWLAAQGATHLALLGRRAPGPEATGTIERLRAAGTEVLAVPCDVSDRAALADALDTIAHRLPPLRGVVHAAGVLDDGALVRQDWSRFVPVLAPKVDGAANLHALTAAMALDHFVLFSSAASLFGSRGQANHAAANSFLDALAAERRARGQAGLSINWGGWSEVGSVVTHGVEDRAIAQGIATMTPAQGLGILGALMVQGRPQVGVVPVDWGTYLRPFGAAVPPWLSRMARRERRLSAPSASPAAVPVIRDELLAAPTSERPQLLLDFVAAQVARVLGAGSPQAVSEQQPLNEMGLDSLMAVELRNLLGAGLGVDQPLAATLVFDHPTVEALARYLDRTVLGGGAGPEPAEVDGDAAVEDLLASIEMMSDDDVARMFGD
jgi:NADPH:quinone reductase-like Zn-dependent oxidoreductase